MQRLHSFSLLVSFNRQAEHYRSLLKQLRREIDEVVAPVEPGMAALDSS